MIDSLLEKLLFLKGCFLQLRNLNFFALVFFNNHLELIRITFRYLLLRLRGDMKQLDFIRLALRFLKIRCFNLISLHHIHFLRFFLLLFLLFLFLFLLMLLFLVSPLAALDIDLLDLEMGDQINNCEDILLTEGLFIKQF